MRRSKFTEEQIIGILREQEAGAKTPELCRRHGISSAIAAWVADDNATGPHSALGYQTPAAYAAQLAASRNRAIVTLRLWFQMDECRGSEH